MTRLIGLSIVMTFLSAPSNAGQTPQLPPSLLCWRDLTPAIDLQGEQVAIAESQLAGTRDGELWLARLWSGPPLLKWSSGKWVDPNPLRPGVDVWVEAVASSPAGDIAIAAAANRDDFSRELHIARLSKGAWQWLDGPLISANKPEVHAKRASIAFAGDRPIVVWSESHIVGLSGVFVARWDGKSWERLASLKPSSDDTFLTPAIAVDARQQIWVAWSDSNEVRVVRWNGSAWLDIGRDTLAKISAAQGPTALREISLLTGADGRVWVARLASKMTGGAAVALARWDGSSWKEVPAPQGPAGKDHTAFSVSMILRNNAPVVAWSQASETDNRHLYVSEWSAGDRWTPLLSGLHLVGGISNVTDVKVASGNRQELFVSWDEQGKDNRGTRVVRAYACAAGERPAVPPASTVERDTWPTTVEQAARQLAAGLDNESKERVRATKKDQLIQYHHGWGTGIRNSLGLWRGNDKLLESCGNGAKVHPDSCSMVIIEAVWTLLQSQK